jgi:hypothetical protein
MLAAVTVRTLDPKRLMTSLAGVRRRRATSGSFLCLALAMLLTVPVAAAEPAGNPPVGWSGWKTIPGRMRTNLSPKVVAHGAYLYVFVTKPSGRVFFNRRGSSGWTGWKGLSASRLTPSSPGAVSFTDAASNVPRLFVLIRGTDDRIYRNVLRKGVWSGWKEVPGGGRTLSSPTGGLNTDDELVVVVRGTNDGIFENRLRYSGWTGWTGIAGVTQVAPDLSSLSAGAYLVLFVLGTDLQLYRRRLDPGATVWGGWQVVPGGQVGSAPANTFSNGEGALAADHLFVRMADSGVYFRRWVGSDYGPWRAVPNGFTASAPTVATYRERVWLVVRDLDNGIQFNRYDPRPQP